MNLTDKELPIDGIRIMFKIEALQLMINVLLNH